MKKITPVFFLFLSLQAFCQDNPTELANPIVAEGKRLYQSEMASWYGTDLFLEKFKDRTRIGGYFSYTEKDTTKCIFFSKGETPAVIGTIAFDSSFSTTTALTSLAERPFTLQEKDIYTIRKTALELINKDTLFKTYQNTNLNLIPLLDSNEKKVYVLTGPSKQGVVIFGNDYLLTFDSNNQLTNKKQLHRNIIPIEYGNKQEEGKEIIGTMHSHQPETGDFITATDICTLMLYSKFAKWKQHNVVSKNYLNIWNCETNRLTVVPMSTMEKINKDQEQQKKKRQE